MTHFEAEGSVRRRDADPTTYDAQLSPHWAIGGKPNGGYTLSIIARAACDAVGAAHPMAVSAHYLRAPDSTDAEVRTEVVRTGRRVSTARSTLWQGGKPQIDALVSTGELHAGPAEWMARPAPDMPPPEDCVPPGTEKFVLEIFDRVDLRIDPATSPFPKFTGDPTIRYWFRLHDGSDPDPFSLLVAVDAAPPTVFNLQRYGWAPTVELTVLLRGLPAPGWLRCESTTRMMSDGWFDEEATVWDSTGRLVAQSRQLALVGERPPKPEA
ncbi:MAG TPA: thioesterase family protein [Mycobacteriales bacterium]|nr:thioesterase family protein [Mycobacteriales bacterium]